MKRITMAMPDEVAQFLEREARRRHTSVSEVIRIAVVAHYGLGQKRRPLPFAKLGSSGHGDTARRIDELIAEEWTLDQHRG